ncbi:MAG: thiamine phosphate synthase [Dehalococcoidia bacterium]|jgi:thiamine-phosphate pyrophosphorylase|nr:thiamine phosphate synthase [Dehalococcoidia bacterium]
MTNLAQSHYQVIFHCIESASRFVPPALSPAPALQSLRDVIPSLPAASAMAETDDGPPTSAQQTLELVSVAADLLSHLDESSSANPLGWETLAGVGRILDALTSQLGSAIRREKADLVRGLYVIIDPQVTGGRDPLAIAQAAIQGGAKMLQLRDKLRDKGESLPLAIDLQKLCAKSGASLILNDHADVAAIVGSAGLHVGQTDLPVEQARQVLAPHQVLGRSNHEIEELLESERMGVDHVAFGAVYHTDTKGVGRPPQGIDQLRLAREAAQTPLVAIGGINAENAAPVIEAGADAICVTAAVGSATEPEAAAARLVKVIEEAGGRV